MTVASLLARKGVKVVTIQPEHQIRQALALLTAGAGDEPLHLTWDQLLTASAVTKP